MKKTLAQLAHAPSVSTGQTPLSWVNRVPDDLHRLFELLIRRARKITGLRRLLLVMGLGLAGVSVVWAVSFFKPQSVQFSYAKPNCFFSPALLPGTISKKTAPGYELELARSFSIGRHVIYSGQTCVKASNLPKVGSHTGLRLAPLGLPLLQKHINVTPAPLPKISLAVSADKPIAPKYPLQFKFDQTDAMFEYQLSANAHSVVCSKQKLLLSCDTAQLNLSQLQSYDFTLTRLLNRKASGVVFSKQLRTLDPLQVASSTITENQTVYDIPSELKVNFTKPLTDISGVKLQLIVNGTSSKDLPASFEKQGTSLTVKFSQPLPRLAKVQLSITDAMAEDHSFLTGPFKLTFNTSGGPKVTGTNIGAYKVDPASTILIKFDRNLLASQAKQGFVRLETAAGAQAVSFSSIGNQITIKPTTPLPACTSFVIKVIDGLQNEFGVSGGGSWQFSSRTTCQVVFSIGSSVQGRSLTAYRFGSGAKKIIFVGGTHGDEKSSVLILNSWVDYLEANAPKIPAGLTVYVIPSINPDGVAAGSRLNAHGVDLNRNFAANNWQSGVYLPGNQYSSQGGGSAPLSEPESRALASFSIAQNPSLVVTYHAKGAVVIGNDSGSSYVLAVTYGTKASFAAYSNASSGGVFDYDSTGEYEDWLHDKPGIPALLVELRTNTSNEFKSHTTAMWAMLQ